MKIVIVGPGAMGCLFAALLSEAGEDVILLDKRERRAAQIAKRGVRVEGIGGRRTVAVRTAAKAASAGTADLVCIFVKSYDTLSAIRSCLPCVGARTIVLTLQNGLGNVEQIEKFAPKRRILAGVTAQGATSLGTGHVRHAGRGPTIIGFLDRRTGPEAIRVARVFNKVGIRARVTTDARKTLWTKLTANAAINPLTALYGVRNGALVEDRKLRRTLREVTREAAKVAVAKGLSVTAGELIKTVEAVCRVTRDNISSMLQDARRRNRTEIEAITGALVREAKALGISVPANESLLRRVRNMGRDHSVGK